MPLIQVRVIKDVFSKEQKRQIIGKLTTRWSRSKARICAASPVRGRGRKAGDWGIGGNALTTADVRARARKSCLTTPFKCPDSGSRRVRAHSGAIGIGTLTAYLMRFDFSSYDELAAKLIETSIHRLGVAPPAPGPVDNGSGAGSAPSCPRHARTGNSTSSAKTHFVMVSYLFDADWNGVRSDQSDASRAKEIMTKIAVDYSQRRPAPRRALQRHSPSSARPKRRRLAGVRSCCAAQRSRTKERIASCLASKMSQRPGVEAVRSGQDGARHQLPALHRERGGAEWGRCARCRLQPSTPSPAARSPPSQSRRSIFLCRISTARPEGPGLRPRYRGRTRPAAP